MRVPIPTLPYLCYNLGREGLYLMAARHRKRPAKNANGEYASFTQALKTVLSVPHSELKAHLDAQKGKKQAKPSSRVSDVQD